MHAFCLHTLCAPKCLQGCIFHGIGLSRSNRAVLPAYSPTTHTWSGVRLLGASHGKLQINFIQPSNKNMRCRWFLNPWPSPCGGQPPRIHYHHYGIKSILGASDSSSRTLLRARFVVPMWVCSCVCVCVFEFQRVMVVGSMRAHAHQGGKKLGGCHKSARNCFQQIKCMCVWVGS